MLHMKQVLSFLAFFGIITTCFCLFNVLLLLDNRWRPLNLFMRSLFNLYYAYTYQSIKSFSQNTTGHFGHVAWFHKFTSCSTRNLINLIWYWWPQGSVILQLISHFLSQQILHLVSSYDSGQARFIYFELVTEPSLLLVSSSLIFLGAAWATKLSCGNRKSLIHIQCVPRYSNIWWSQIDLNMYRVNIKLSQIKADIMNSK